jgi:hypothetical protein
VDDLLLGEEAPADVQFTTYHPKEMKPRTWYTVLTYVHLPDAAGDVHKDSRRRLVSHAAEYSKGMGKATTVVKRGSEIEIVPELAGCRFNPPRASIIWLKDWHRIEFEVQADPEQSGYAEEHAMNGTIAFYVGAVLIGEARIWAHITEHPDHLRAEAMNQSLTIKPYRKIFVSYSHQDAKVVDALEVAYNALGDIYLRDVRALRAGEAWKPALLEFIEEADIFQLYWSKEAERSEYVREELKHALKQCKPAPFIRPVYWEVPMPMPPDGLKDIHFVRLNLCTC